MGTKSEPRDGAMMDQCWRGYDPRAGFPAIITATGASVGVLAGRWYFEDLFWLADQAGALAFYAVTLAVWPGLLSTLIYRVITYTYRLTDRAVLIDWGFRNLPEPPVWYADLVSVSADASWMGRWLGFGRVILTARNGRVVMLEGVAQPIVFAEAIRAAAEKFRTAT